MPLALDLDHQQRRVGGFGLTAAAVEGIEVGGCGQVRARGGEAAGIPWWVGLSAYAVTLVLPGIQRRALLASFPTKSCTVRLRWPGRR